MIGDCCDFEAMTAAAAVSTFAACSIRQHHAVCTAAAEHRSHIHRVGWVNHLLQLGVQLRSRLQVTLVQGWRKVQIEGEQKLSGLTFCFIPQKPLLLESKTKLDVKRFGQEL